MMIGSVFVSIEGFFLDNIYEKNHKIKTNLFSKLLVRKMINLMKIMI